MVLAVFTGILLGSLIRLTRITVRWASERKPTSFAWVGKGVALPVCFVPILPAFRYRSCISGADVLVGVGCWRVEPVVFRCRVKKE